MLDKGYSYTTAPLIAISPPPSGETATSVAITTAIGDGSFYVDRLEITNPDMDTWRVQTFSSLVELMTTLEYFR